MPYVGSIGAVYYGLSTDTKPVVDNGHYFIETDTLDLFIRIGGNWRRIGGELSARWMAQLTSAVELIIDGNGAVISTGVAGDIEVPFDCTIIAGRLFANQSGSIEIDVWRDTYANFPPTVADSIVASAPLTITSAQNSQDTTLTGWTTSLTAGDILRYNVNSVTSIQRVTVSLTVAAR